MQAINKMVVKCRSRVAGLPMDIAWHLGLNRSFMGKARGARILVYHGICRNNHLK